jgi:hypothetical protein
MNLSDTCFKQNKVNWLIANHIRIQMDWSELEKPLKTIESSLSGTAAPARNCRPRGSMISCA